MSDFELASDEVSSDETESVSSISSSEEESFDSSEESDMSGSESDMSEQGESPRPVKRISQPLSPQPARVPQTVPYTAVQTSVPYSGPLVEIETKPRVLHVTIPNSVNEVHKNYLSKLGHIVKTRQNQVVYSISRSNEAYIRDFIYRLHEGRLSGAVLDVPTPDLPIQPSQLTPSIKPVTMSTVTTGAYPEPSRKRKEPKVEPMPVSTAVPSVPSAIIDATVQGVPIDYGSYESLPQLPYDPLTKEPGETEAAHAYRTSLHKQLRDKGVPKSSADIMSRMKVQTELTGVTYDENSTRAVNSFLS